jgi:uncharacterized protein
MQQHISRPRLENEINACLAEAPVTVLLGARQVGKTTLARLASKGRDDVTFFDLERASSLESLAQTPELTLKDLSGLVIIDEIQKMPNLFRVLRPLCDIPGRKATYLLLGSASPDIVKGVSETLAGRALFIQVPGFALDEVGNDKQNRLWLHGSFPMAFMSKSPESAQRWIESFIQTFLERDIPQLGIRIPSMTLRRFWTMLAHYHGQMWNASELGRSMSVNPATVTHYRDLLSGAFVVRTLPPWFENLKKRQIRAPKIYIRDSGILHGLLSIESMNDLRSHPRYGASWEGFAIEQTLARLGDRDAYYWATQRGAELDLMLIRHGKRWGFEFKCSDAPAMTKSMHIALQDLGLEQIWVVYPGADRYQLHEKVVALPLRQLDQAVEGISRK